MAGTAFVAAAMLVAGGAMAQDKMKKKMMKPSISVNGYYEAVIGGILDEDLGAGASDTSALDVRTEGEIHFNGRSTLDSGIKIHVRVELEAMDEHAAPPDRKGAGDPIDEYFVSVSGSFGQIILGGTGGAPVKMLTGISGSWATSVGETFNFDNNWVPPAHRPPLHYNLQHARLDTGDIDKVTYISPKFGGFQVGMTYAPSGHNSQGWGNDRIPANSMIHDGIEGAVKYSGKFGDVGFSVGAGMTAYQGANTTGVGNCVANPGMANGDAVTTKCSPNPAADRSDWLVAASLDFGGGFRVSVAHKRVTNDDDATQSQLTDAGVRYVQGANSFSLVGSVGEMDEGEEAHTAVMGSYARALGPGVKLHMNLLWNDTSNKAGTTENSGIAGITGIKVVF